MLEITLWDQARVREEESEFLGEVPQVVQSKASLPVLLLGLS